MMVMVPLLRYNPLVDIAVFFCWQWRRWGQCCFLVWCIHSARNVEIKEREDDLHSRASMHYDPTVED